MPSDTKTCKMFKQNIPKTLKHNLFINLPGCEKIRASKNNHS